MTIEGWMVVVCGRSNVVADGCEESTPVASFDRRMSQRNTRFEIKRNKAHGGCLGIERR